MLLPELRGARLITLGRFALEPAFPAAGGILPAGKPLALITYLHCQPGRAAARDSLTDALWGDHDEERARHNLRQAVLMIRQRLGDGAVLTGDGIVRLAAEIDADRDALLRAIANDDSTTACALYAGDFLAHFASAGTVEFEHWADAERARLREAFLTGINRWARAAQAQGRLREAAELCRAGLRVNREREPLWRILLESMALAAPRALVMAEAEAMRLHFTEDGRSMAPATNDLIRRLMRDEEQPAAVESSAIVPDFVGREDVFAALIAAWESARQGRAAIVRIAGGVGIGKTRLVEELRVRLARTGARVVAARGHQGERTVPFALAGDVAMAVAGLPGSLGVSPGAASAILGLAPAASTKFPTATPDRGDDADSVRRRGAALGELLSAVAEDRPCVVVIDDMHWSDASSHAVIEAAARRAHGRILVVMTSRAAWQSSERQEVRTLTLRPLSDIEVEELVASIGLLPQERWATDWIAHVRRASEGVPLAVLQMVTYALEKGALALRAREFSCVDPVALAAFGNAGTGLRGRLEALPPQAQRLLALLAAAGTPVSHVDVAAAMDMPAGALRELLDRLEHSGLVRTDAGSIELGHDEVADAVATAVSSPLRHEAAATLGRIAADSAGGDVMRLRFAARLLMEGGDDERLRQLFRAWVSRRNSADGWCPGPLRARDLIGADAPEPVVRNLSRALPFAQRIPHWQRAAIVLIGVAGVAAGGATAFRSAPVPVVDRLHLAVTTEPLADTVGPLLVAPIVEVRDANERRVDTDTAITVDLLLYGGDIRLHGPTSVRAKAGVVRFDSLQIGGAMSAGADWQLRFAAAGMAPILSRRWSSAVPAAIWIEAGSFGGHVLDPRDPVVTIARGDSLKGEVTLRFRTPWQTASVMLGMAPSWEDRRASARTVTAMPTPVEEGRRRIPVRFAGTSRPGQYRLLIALSAEPRAEYAFSSTNWKTGDPVWNDGNDLQDLGDRDLQFAQDSGWAWVSVLRIDEPTTTAGMSRIPVALASIRVVVR